MKTAEQLGISAEEHAALITVRGGLKEGRYIHVRVAEELESEGKPAPERIFNLATTFFGEDCGVLPGCGQVGCIGGWVGYELGYKSPGHYVSAYEPFELNVGKSNSPLSQLYYPYIDGDLLETLEDVTELQAAQAIENFLNTGDPDWESAAPDVVAKHRAYREEEREWEAQREAEGNV